MNLFLSGVIDLVKSREAHPEGLSSYSSPDGRLVYRLLNMPPPIQCPHPLFPVALLHPSFDERHKHYGATVAQCLMLGGGVQYLEVLDPSADRIRRDLTATGREGGRLLGKADAEGAHMEVLRHDDAYPYGVPTEFHRHLTPFPGGGKRESSVYLNFLGRAAHGVPQLPGRHLERVIEGVLGAYEDSRGVIRDTGLDPDGEVNLVSLAAGMGNELTDDRGLRTLAMDSCTATSMSIALNRKVVECPALMDKMVASEDKKVLRSLAAHYDKDSLGRILNRLHEVGAHVDIAEVLLSPVAPEWVSRMRIPAEVIAGVLADVNAGMRQELICKLDRLDMSEPSSAQGIGAQEDRKRSSGQGPRRR